MEPSSPGPSPQTPPPASHAPNPMTEISASPSVRICIRSLLLGVLVGRGRRRRPPPCGEAPRPPRAGPRAGGRRRRRWCPCPGWPAANHAGRVPSPRGRTRTPRWSPGIASPCRGGCPRSSSAISSCSPSSPRTLQPTTWGTRWVGWPWTWTSGTRSASPARSRSESAHRRPASSGISAGRLRERRGHARDGREVLPPRAPATLSLVAEDLGLEAQAPAHVQRAGAGRAAELVRRDREQVDVQAAHVERQPARRVCTRRCAPGRRACARCAPPRPARASFPRRGWRAGRRPAPCPARPPRRRTRPGRPGRSRPRRSRRPRTRRGRAGDRRPRTRWGAPRR